MIYVLAGVNGAGKSSIAGEAIRASGGNWYNPDEIVRAVLKQAPHRSQDSVNAEVWAMGLDRLKLAIRKRHSFTFETTLGGNSIAAQLLDATTLGLPVCIWYCGLESADLHVQRVAARVARGGHDIPEAMIRKRCLSSMRNLCHLAPRLAELVVYDNSAPLNQHGLPSLRRLLHAAYGRADFVSPDMPAWAKPVAAVVTMV